MIVHSVMTLPFLAVPSRICIYQGSESNCINYAKLASYLESLLKGWTVTVRPEFFQFNLLALRDRKREVIHREIAYRMAKFKIRDILGKDIFPDPLPVEIEFETRNLSKAYGRTFGLIYEGFRLQQLCGELISNEEKTPDYLHLIFTNQLFATWDNNDCRYHARVAIFGFPAILSTTGLVEAPAKPRDFYLRKQLGENVHVLKEELGESFIDYNDRRMTEVMKGYAAQAVFYYLEGNTFCDDSNCRLFNAHRQSEVIRAQSTFPYEFCPRHQAMLDRLQELEEG